MRSEDIACPAQVAEAESASARALARATRDFAGALEEARQGREEAAALGAALRREEANVIAKVRSALSSAGRFEAASCIRSASLGCSLRFRFGFAILLSN